MKKRSTAGLATPALLLDLVDTLIERGRSLFSAEPPAARRSAPELAEIARLVLSRSGEASAVFLAQSLLDGYRSAGAPERLAFLQALVEEFGPNPGALDAAIEAVREAPTPERLAALHKAAEPRRQELFRRLNMVHGGTAALVKMREDLRGFVPEHPALKAVDADFAHLLASWFNRGFLEIRRIDWTTSAEILEKIIRYEAVHAIEDWDDLRNRLAPPDRRCYGFFHPQLPDEPLIFVEVALTENIPAAIAPLLDQARTPIAAEDATTAVFYSISNTQRGLAGVSFGNFLIKQVATDLKRELPGLATFVTLSPLPGFSAWLASEHGDPDASLLGPDRLKALEALDASGLTTEPALAGPLAEAATIYLREAKGRGGRPLDPVARFHLGNGAELERIDVAGDGSPNGLRQSHGVMVNYLYALDRIERNHETFAETGAVITSPAFREPKPARSDARRGGARQMGAQP